MPKSAKRYVHINQNNIKHNHKTGDRLPAISIKKGNENTYANRAQILGPATVVYSPDKPLKCGARVWIETEHEVVPLTGADDDILFGAENDDGDES